MQYCNRSCQSKHKKECSETLKLINTLPDSSSVSAHYYPASVSSIPISTDSIPAGDGSSTAYSCSTQRITSSCSVPSSTNSSCSSTAYISSADLRSGSVTSTNSSASSEAEHS